MNSAPLATQNWSNYEFLPSFILGFHGCDVKVGEGILRGNIQHLNFSENEYDWLGNGIYFWESSPARALQFAQERAQGGRNSKGKIKKPFVLGAIIDLRHCLNLADSSAIAQVQDAYEVLQVYVGEAGETLPTNGKACKARYLDCLVFNSLHRIRETERLLPYDTVRGLFLEGKEMYSGAGILDRNHIQICVRQPDCILGYFRPIVSDTEESA